MEDTMVDMSNLLAEIATPYVTDDGILIESSSFSQGVERFSQRQFNAKIWDLNKSDSELRVYITDKQGIVIYDSKNLDLGENYSQWRDVYLTLRGKYGARTTLRDPNDTTTSVMHVAAPILYKGEIVGVLAVAKPNISVQPFIELAREKMTIKSLWLLGASLVFGLVAVAWLTRSIRKLVDYATQLSQGKRANYPVIREPELAKLGEAMEVMREELEGKNYIENYVHTLTHEMKSPLSTIKGAAELLLESMPIAERENFLGNILAETDRLQDFVQRLLALTTIEHRASLKQPVRVNLETLSDDVIKQKEPVWNQKKITIKLKSVGRPIVKGEYFLLEQAVINLLDNAIAYSQQGDVIVVDISVDERNAAICIRDQGSGVPDYAQEKVFERFYSLPRPITGKKSSGLGLCFVKEIAELHGGSIKLTNYEGGVEATLVLPRDI